MRLLGIHKNIPVSDAKLTLILLVGFISSHMTEGKLLPVNSREITGLPKMSLVFEAKSKPVFIIKPILIHVMHTDDLGCYMTSNQQGQMLVPNLNRFVR